MPKPKIVQDEVESKKTLPDVLELKFEGCEEAVLLLERLQVLQTQVGVKPDDKRGKEGSGLLAEMHVIKSKLSSIIAVEGLPGLRHNNLVFSDCWVEGRATLDAKALKIELVQAGVDLGLVNKCIEKATKVGDGYARRMLVDLNKPKSDWSD